MLPTGTDRPYHIATGEKAVYSNSPLEWLTQPERQWYSRKSGPENLSGRGLTMASPRSGIENAG